jgi:hypothetical protein
VNFCGDEEQRDFVKNAMKKRSLYLDDGKVKRVQRILKTQTGTETIDWALDLVVFRKEILRSLERTAGRGWGGKSNYL